MDFQWATRPEERNQLWQARHDAYFACLQIRPGSRAVSTDVCVPISRLAECVHETMEGVKDYIAPVPLLGDIGDGTFHLSLHVDPAKPRRRSRPSRRQSRTRRSSCAWTKRSCAP